MVVAATSLVERTTVVVVSDTVCVVDGVDVVTTVVVGV